MRINKGRMPVTSFVLVVFSCSLIRCISDPGYSLRPERYGVS
jgi:hypothetical protein